MAEIDDCAFREQQNSEISFFAYVWDCLIYVSVNNYVVKMTDFIDVQRATYTDLSEKYAVLGSLYEQKCVHLQNCCGGASLK